MSGKPPQQRAAHCVCSERGSLAAKQMILSSPRELPLLSLNCQHPSPSAQTWQLFNSEPWCDNWYNFLEIMQRLMRCTELQAIHFHLQLGTGSKGDTDSEEREESRLSQNTRRKCVAGAVIAGAWGKPVPRLKSTPAGQQWPPCCKGIPYFSEPGRASMVYIRAL